ncbi:MAG: hypothetical protein K2L30_09215 [Duncaniella sp.]|nr:hypothetical protein [Duncaniella sp.]
MKTTLSQPEMIARWRLHRYHEPLRNDCSVTRTDGIDLDSIIVTEMEAWYFNLLDTAPPDLLVTADISSEVAMSRDSDGVARIPLPTGVRRVIEVGVSSWPCPAQIVTDPHSATARRQRHKFTRAGSSSPVAIHSGGVLTLYSVPQRGRLTTLTVVRDPEPGTYPLDTRALALI